MSLFPEQTQPDMIVYLLALDIRSRGRNIGQYYDNWANKKGLPLAQANETKAINPAFCPQ